MRSFPALCVAAVLIGAAATGGALAQTRPVAPPPVSPLPSVVPPRAPDVRLAPAAPREKAGGAMPDMNVPVSTVVIEGMTVYRPSDFAALTATLRGAAVPLARIDAVREAILRRYRDDGYALTAVSAIVEPGGVLRLRVTEGRIAEVQLDGDIGPAGVQVLRFLSRLTRPAVIDAATLERALLLAGDVPGVSLRAVLRPSAADPGALTLVAQVTRRAVGGQVSIDNRAFANVGPVQGLAVLDVNSLSEFGEHTQLSVYRTLNGAQLFGNAAFDVFLGGSGLRLRLYGGDGYLTPTGPFRAIDYIGRTSLIGAELSYPLIRSRRQTINLVGVFEAIGSTVKQYGGPYSADELRVLRAGADYAVSDLLLGADRSAVNALTVRLSHGLDALGATPAGAELAGRFRQRPDFTKLSADFTRTQVLFAPWQGASVALQGIVAGQYTPDILPAPEKFFLGGSRLARGFYYGQTTGDNALTASLEAQLDMVNSLGWLGLDTEVSSQVYAFYDWAETWQNQRLDSNTQLRSVGLGVRVIPLPRLEFDAEVVQRLTRFPTGGGPGVSPLAASAFYWRLLARF